MSACRPRVRGPEQLKVRRARASPNSPWSTSILTNSFTNGIIGHAFAGRVVSTYVRARLCLQAAGGAPRECEFGRSALGAPRFGTHERKAVWSAPRKVSVARLARVMSTRRRIELEVLLTASLALPPWRRLMDLCAQAVPPSHYTNRGARASAATRAAHAKH